MNDCTRTEEQVVDYLDGALSRAEREVLDAHVAHCAKCGDSLRAYRAIREAYRSAPADDVGVEIVERLRAAAHATRPVARPPRRITRILAAVAAGLLVAAIVGVLRSAGAGEETASVADRVQRAEQHLASGEPERALSLYEEALDLAAGDARAAEILHRLGALHVHMGSFEQARERLDEVAAAYPDYPERKAVLLLRGQALAGLGEAEQAIRTYERVAAEFPGEREEVAQRILELEERELSAEFSALGYIGE